MNFRKRAYVQALKADNVISTRSGISAVLLVTFLFILVLPGCKGKAGQVSKVTTPVDSQPLSTVVLQAATIQKSDGNLSRVEISASGKFGSNIVPKTEPERIIVILHNAQKGVVPSKIDVNDGIVNRVEIDQLDTGRGSAVRIVLLLEHKSDYRVNPIVNGLTIDIKKT